jgi:hypothetical protein
LLPQIKRKELQQKKVNNTQNTDCIKVKKDKMGNILQDMMGLLSRKKVVKEVEPTDLILLGRTPNPEDSMFVVPKMNNQLITIKDLKAHFDEGEISGGGTVNTIAMFTPDGSTIGDSIITQDSVIPQVTVNGELRVSTNTYVGSNLTVDGNTILNGDLQIGDQATDVLLVNSETEFNANVVFDQPGYVEFRGAVADNTGSLGTAGQILSSTGTTVEWIDNTVTGTVTGTGTTNKLPLWTDGPNGVLGDSGFYQSPPTAILTAGAVSLNTTFSDTNYGEVPGLRVASRVTNTPGVIDLFRNDATVTTGESVGILQYSVLDDGRYAVAQIGVETLTTSGSGDSGGGKFLFKTAQGGGSGPSQNTPESRFTLDYNSADFLVPINVTSTLLAPDPNNPGTPTPGISGQVLSSTGTGIQWIDAASGTGTVESITALSPLTGGTITETGSIGINQASTSADGYLSSTDWNTFNSKQSTSEKGQADGYAPLDSNNKVPTVHLPDSLVGAVVYQGTWDASTDSPTLPTPDLANKGHYYIVSNPGTYSGITYAIGDWAISNGSAWQKVDNTQDVNSVFGRQGNVVAIQSDYAAFYADIDDAYSDAKVDLNLNVASAASGQVLSWSGTDYVWVDQPSIPSVPTNIVETVDTQNGTYINMTPTGAVDGDVVVTAELSAVDGTDTSGLFLSKDNVWSTIPGGNPGTVTSVGQTHAGNAFSVTGSPITTAGVLAIGLNGNATQYIDGEGNLQTFPTIPTLPANIVNTVTGGTNITTTNDTTTGDVVVNAPDAIVNTDDTFGGPKVVNIVCLTSAQYPPAAGVDPNTLYIII